MNSNIQLIKSQIENFKFQIDNIEMQNNNMMMMNPINEQLSIFDNIKPYLNLINHNF